MKKIRVYHGFYGCDTGCCGHIIEIDDQEEYGKFSFEHPRSNESLLEFAKRITKQEYGEEHCQDLDWENAELDEISED